MVFKKRKVLITLTLILSLLVGKPRLSSSRSSSPNFGNQAIHERLIDDREFNPLDQNDRQVILVKSGDSGVGFQPINPAPPPPHIESARNLLFGSPKPDQLSCQQLSRFDQQQQFQEAEYPSAVTVEEALKLPDVITYEAAKKYAEMNLPERLYVNEQHYISGVMAAKKTPHAPEIGLNPVDYGMKAEHVTLIRGMGLYQYLQKGYPLPPLEFIKDYQNQVKGICLESETTTLDDKPYTHNRKTPISIYENQGMSKSGKSVTIVVFDNTPGKGDIITMGKRGDRYMDQVKESGNMGTGGGTI
jgi:hypothetical protein